MASALDVFSFHVTRDPRPFETFRAAQRRITAARTGRKFVLVRGDQLEYFLKGEVTLPQPASASKTLLDWLRFCDDHKALQFLVMPFTGDTMNTETTTYAGDGATSAFAFKHKYLRASTVLTYVNGAPAGGVLSGNNTAPVFTFSSIPANLSEVKLVSRFYAPCVFASDPLEEGDGIGDEVLNADMPRSFAVEVVEVEPGARFVSPSTAPKGP